MPVEKNPNAKVHKLAAFAEQSRGYVHTFAVGEGPEQFCTKLRRLTQSEMEALDYTAEVVPPAIPDAKPDAPYAERFNVEDIGYIKAWNRAFLRKIADTLHAAIEGGVPEERPAADTAPAASDGEAPPSDGSAVVPTVAASAEDATDRRLRWIEKHLPIPVRNALLRAVEEISQTHAITLAGFI
jgi:hypothetical protein